MVTDRRTCPGCYEVRRKSSFWEVYDRKYIKRYYCNTCRQEDNKFDAWVDKVLRGVYIPFYETPVIKYIDKDIVAKRNY